MKRLLSLVALGAVTLSACGVDPVSDRLGIHNANLVSSAMCTKVTGTGTHASQQFDLKTDKTARISVQAGAPVTVNLNCTYEVTTIVNDKPVVVEKTEPLTTTQVVGRSADLYVTVLRTPTESRAVKIAEAYYTSPATLNASADPSICTEFSATVAPAYSNAPITLTKLRTTDLGYYAQGDEVKVSATCLTETAGESGPVTKTAVLSKTFTLTKTATLTINAGTDADGNPVLSHTVN